MMYKQPDYTGYFDATINSLYSTSITRLLIGPYDIKDVHTISIAAFSSNTTTDDIFNYTVRVLCGHNPSSFSDFGVLGSLPVTKLLQVAVYNLGQPYVGLEVARTVPPTNPGSISTNITGYRGRRFQNLAGKF